MPVDSIVMLPVTFSSEPIETVALPLSVIVMFPVTD